MSRQRGRPSTWPGIAVLLCALATIALSLFGDHARLHVDDARMAMERQARLIAWQLGLPQWGQPDLDQLDAALAAKSVHPGAAIFMRVFKKESELELWMQSGERFVLVRTYPICRWSGALGPKFREGDRQSPEGIYTVGRRQLNPASRWHRSFNLGFPNAFDRAHGRTGSFLMVHGGCSSIGCYAVTNDAVDEIWRLIRAAMRGGQPRFQVQAFPFRMTQANLALHASLPWDAFWRTLKPAYDHFEATRIPPLVSVCERGYAARAGWPGYDGRNTVRAQCAPELAPDDLPVRVERPSDVADLSGRSG